MQPNNRQYFRRRRIKGFFLALVALIYTALPAAPGRTEELSDDYNHGLGKIDLRSQSPAQSLRFTLPLLIPGDIEPGWGVRISDCTQGGAFIFRIC